MTKPVLAATVAAALSGLVAAAAIAQNSAPALAAAMKANPKPGPKSQDDANTVTVVVTNSRKSDLVQLQAAESGSVAWKKVLGPLKSGAHATAVLPRQFNCRVDLHGTFADGQTMEASDVEVCAEKTLNLTE